MTSRFTPYREPLSATLARTGAIAISIGAALAMWSGGGVARFAVATALALWPTLGGHFVELWFLNWLRPRLGVGRAVQVVARLIVWSIGGALFALAMGSTAAAMSAPMRPAWWVGGLGFIGLELVVHLALHARGRLSFYDGRG